MRLKLRFILWIVLVFIFSILSLESNNYQEKHFENNGLSYKLRLFNNNIGTKIRLLAFQGGSDSLIAEVQFKYKVLKYELIDINEDGTMDFIFLIKKKSRYSVNEELTLYLYSYNKYGFYALWKASKIGNKLVDFSTLSIDDKSYVKVLDQLKNDSFRICLYKWNVFGLNLFKIEKQNLDSLKAIKELNK